MAVMIVVMMMVLLDNDGKHERDQFGLLEYLLQFVLVQMLVDVLVDVFVVQIALDRPGNAGQTQDEEDERREQKSRLNEQHCGSSSVGQGIR